MTFKTGDTVTVRGPISSLDRKAVITRVLGDRVELNDGTWDYISNIRRS